MWEARNREKMIYLLVVDENTHNVSRAAWLSSQTQADDGKWSYFSRHRAVMIQHRVVTGGVFTLERLHTAAHRG